jgi:hypothetical protein
VAFPSTLQVPQTGGITPGGAVGAQLAAITRRGVIPAVWVQIYQSHPLLSLLISNAQRAAGGIGAITAIMQGAPFTSFSWGSFAGDFPTPEEQEALQQASFNLKLGLVPIGFFGMESLVQASEVIIPKLRAVMSDAAVVMKQGFAQALYSNNFATNTVISSLVQAYDNGALAPSYGGITRAGNLWIQGQVIPGAQVVNNRVGMATTLVRVQTGAGGENPDFGVMHPADWATLMADYMGYEQYQSRPRSMYGKDDAQNAGFRAIRVLDTPIFADPFCPRGEAYMINSRYLALYMHERTAPMVFSDFHSLIPQSQIAEIGVLISPLELVCTKPSSGAHITGLAGGQVWPSTPPAVA